MPESLFLIKLQPEACNFIKQEALTQLFSCEFCEISKNTFSYRTPPRVASMGNTLGKQCENSVKKNQKTFSFLT